MLEADKLEEIISGLSEAQRKWIPEFDAEPRQWYPIGCSRPTLRALVRLGFVEEIRPPFFGMVKWRLTPLGLALKAHMKGQL